MDHNELEEPQNDFVVEITDLDQDGEVGSSSAPRFFTETWLFPHKHHKLRAIVATTCVGLVLLIVLFTTAPFNRLFVYGSSASTFEPSTYYFGLDANPPWGSLSVDGKRVALFSRGAYTLFSLPHGQHTLTWYAAPFAPEQCRISVPLESGHDTCYFPDAAPHLGDKVSAYIRFPSNVSMLSAIQRTALLQATQAVLDSQQSSETVQVGEVYAQTPETTGTNTGCTLLERAAICFAAAHQPLRATLRLQLDTGLSPNGPCANGTCDSGSQRCLSFCDALAFIGSNITRSPAVWQVFVRAQLLWRFATDDGRVVEENQANSFILGQQNVISVPLNITWNGMKWSVILNNQNSSFGNDGPVCQTAVEDMDTLAFASNPPNAEQQSVSGPTYASGCLIKILFRSSWNDEPVSTATVLTIAYVIQRFGVLLAVNAVAHHLWPFLPIADASALYIAHQLLTNEGRAE